MIVSEERCFSCYRDMGDPHDPRCPKRMVWEWEQKLPMVDLRGICRAADRCFTEVRISVGRYGPWEHRWLLMGEGHLDRFNQERSEYTLRAYLGRGATDFEHDSAYAAQLVLHGVTWKNVMYHCVEFTGFIPPDIEPEDFRVPPPGYNPFELSETVACERCDDGHPIVPEGYYVPKGDPNAMKLLRGKRVSVIFGTVRSDDDA